MLARLRWHRSPAQLIDLQPQSVTDESFNGKLRDEWLSIEWFRSRHEARVVIEQWRRHYNAVRPHSSLRYLTPLEFMHQQASIPNHAVL